MSWAGIWGGKFIQPWNSFPAEKWGVVPLSDETHASMNHDVLEEVPWNLEQTPMPLSGSTAGKDGLIEGQVNLETVSQYAYRVGFTRFKINLPAKEDSVYTVSANTMSGDITDARDDRTMHIDRYTGKVLGEVAWADYNLIAKSMAAGIALHQGDMGWWNRLLNTLFCLSFMFMAISGVVMWWSRRALSNKFLAAPIAPKKSPKWISAIIITTLLSLLFPMAGIAIVTILLIDWLIVSRVNSLNYHLK